MHEVFIQRALPLIRHDYHAFESYLGELTECMPLPLKVLRPRDDPVVSAAQCRDWLSYSTCDRAHMHETTAHGHFFLTERAGRDELVELLLELLAESL